MRALFSWLFVTAGCLGLIGCDSPTGPRACTAIAVDALVVAVVEAATGQRICDAAVLAIDGGFSANLRPFPAGQDCTYSGPTERAGTYEVRASKAGYDTAAQTGVRVTADECHVIPVRVTLQLRRSGS